MLQYTCVVSTKIARVNLFKEEIPIIVCLMDWVKDKNSHACWLDEGSYLDYFIGQGGP